MIENDPIKAALEALDSDHVEAEVRAFNLKSQGSRLKAAMHEAAHAVVGAVEGMAVGPVAICAPTGSDDTGWGGRAVVDVGNPSELSEVVPGVRVAVAGAAVEGIPVGVTDLPTWGEDRPKAEAFWDRERLSEEEWETLVQREFRASQAICRDYLGAIEVVANALVESVDSDAPERGGCLSGAVTRGMLNEELGVDVQEAPDEWLDCDCGTHGLG